MRALAASLSFACATTATAPEQGGPGAAAGACQGRPEGAMWCEGSSMKRCEGDEARTHDCATTFPGGVCESAAGAVRCTSSHCRGLEPGAIVCRDGRRIECGSLVSSTRLREMFARGEQPPPGTVPESVVRYVQKYDLYR